MSSESNSKPIKILTVGAAVGSISDLFAKIKTIDAKHGKFDFALCTGDFFGEPNPDASEENDTTRLLEGKLEVPLECYIMQGEHALPDAVIEKFAKTGGELCKDVFLLSKSGIVTTAQGLRLACLGGTYEPSIYVSSEAPPGFASPFFSAQTTDRLLSNALAKAPTTSSSKTNKNYSSLAAIASSASESQIVDVLITNVWPASIPQFSSVPLPIPELNQIGVLPLDDVIRRLKPRYHFAACGGSPPRFWEREPFVWSDEGGRVTRFVSLGAFGGEPTAGKKQRWFYAFSLVPGAPSPPKPANATKNPFTESAPGTLKRPIEAMGDGQNFIFGDVRQPGKRTRVDHGGKPPPGYKCKRCDSTEHFINDCPERQVPPEGYVCKVCNEPGHFVRDCPTRHAVGDTGGKKPKEGYVCRACGSELHYLDDCPIARQSGGQGERRGKRGPPREIGPDECWFCLSNPSLAKHLIVSIGTECYVSLPKGQLIPTQSSLPASSSPMVPGGGHVLIVPITHYPTYSSIPAEMAEPILEETEKYKQAIRAFYAKNGCAAVMFEIGRTSGRGVHAHIQAVPIPQKLAQHAEKAFSEEGKRINVEFDVFDAEAAAGRETLGGGYFRVDLPDGRKMVHRMTGGAPFNLQFGRQVIADLLNTPDRMDWKTCMLPEDEDKADAQAFKQAFAAFDPSL